jgi:alpha-beta hydrolase superfamily lysophospholipase
MPAEHQEVVLHAHDGTAVFAQRWGPCDTPARAELLIVPGFAEHSGRYRELAHALCNRGITTLAIDPRGHGQSSGRRGHVDSFDDYLADVEVSLTAMRGSRRFVLGHSQGGLIVLEFVARRSTELAGVIVTNPFLALAAPIAPAKLAVGRLLAHVWPTLSLGNDIDPALLSHDTAIVEDYRRDPLVFRVATPGWLREVTAAQTRVRAMTTCRVPLLYVYSDQDGLSLPAASQALSEQLVAADKTVLVRPGELHEVLNETNRSELFGQLADWILARAG